MMDSSYWCEDCGKGQEEECKLHEVIHVKDRIVQTYARLTLPHTLNVKVVEFRAVGAHIHGVYPKKIIQKRTQFGPLIAPTLPAKVTLEQKLSLKIFSSPGESSHVNFSSEEECNWLMFVRPAKTREEQNMIAYQHKGKIYYTTTQVIPPGKELKVWYAADYAKLMKKKLLSQITGDIDNYYSFYSDDDTSDNEGCEVTPEPPPPLMEVLLFDCSVCKAAFTEFQLFERHICSKTVTSNEPLVIDELVDERRDEGGNEDDSRSDDSPQKRNKRKGNPVKLSKAGRVIKRKEKADGANVEDSPEAPKVKETKRRRAKRPKLAKTDAKLGHAKLDNGTLENGSVVIAELKIDTPQQGCVDLPLLDIKQENIPEIFEKCSEENDPQTENVENSQSENVEKPPEKKRLHKCEVCGKCYPSRNRLKIHMYAHTGERPFECEHVGCTKAFSSKFKLMRHILIHKPKSKIHACPHCDMTFNRKDHLKNHLRVHDPNKPIYTCNKCGKEYSTSFAYRTHMGFHQAEEGSLTCFVCAQEFEDKDKLIYHLKIHAGAQSVKGIMQRKEKCPHCDKRFYTQKDVRRHVIVHTREKDFLCQYCPQRFGRRDHLTRHLRKAHTGSESLLMTYAANSQQQETYPVNSKPQESYAVNSRQTYTVKSKLEEAYAANQKEETYTVTVIPKQETYVVSSEHEAYKQQVAEEPPLPPDLKSCKVEATVPPLDYQPVQQIDNLVINTSHDPAPNVTVSTNDLAETAQRLLESCQRGIHPSPHPGPIMTAQISPNTQYVYLRNTMPSSQQYLPISSSSLSPLPSLPLQSIPLAVPGNSAQQILTKLESKPFDNLVSTLVPMLNIQCNPGEDKITAQDLGLTVVQNVVTGMPDRDQTATLLAHAPLQHHRDLTLPSPSPSSATIDTSDHRFFPPTTHIDPDKLSLPISSPAPSTADLDPTDSFSYVQTSQVLDKLPEVNLSDRRFFMPGGHLDDIKLQDGPCIITESQLASYVETLKVLSSLPTIQTGNANGQVTTGDNINAIASMSYTPSLPEFTHSFQ